VGSFSRQSGDYRRPLDPGRARLLQAEAQSWRRLSPAFSLLGRVTFDQERLDPGTRADFTEAFPSSPFVTTDTSGTAVRRTRTALEGAAGWKLGQWNVGVTAGYEARDHLSIVSTTVRRVRSTTPGLVLGASREIGRTRLGAFVRWRHSAETVLLYTRTGSGQIHELTGYREVPFISLSTSYYKRREHGNSSIGGSMDGSTWGTRWSLYAEVTRQDEQLTRQERNDPALDSWDQSGWTVGAALQRQLESRLLLTLHIRNVSLSGHADLALDSSADVFRADESAFEAELEARLLAAPKGWSGTLTLGITRESRTRRDLSNGLVTSVTSGTPSFALELGRDLGSRLFAAAGWSVALYGPTSAIPDPAMRGPVYRSYFAREYELYSSRANPTAVSILIRHEMSPSVRLWTSGRLERLSSAESVSTFAPGVSRSAGSLRAGVTVSP
jgi:hypothetical protein